jgi:hypothetical protein
MNILYSLKTGGCFHYAPDLPFIEQYLNKNKFALEKYEINEYDFHTVIIKRKSTTAQHETGIRDNKKV